MVCPLFSVAIVILTLSSELIGDGSINLNPDYQRGTNPAFYLSAHVVLFPCREGVVWSEQKQIGGSQGLMELGRCVQTSDQGLW
jgi:hypothetical protein